MPPAQIIHKSPLLKTFNFTFTAFAVTISLNEQSIKFMSVVFCMVPVAPMRAQAAHRAEQVSQLLFGEVAEVLETSKVFIRIKAMYDGYEGWCQASQLIQTSTEHIQTHNHHLAADRQNEVLVNDHPMYIPPGSSLALFNNNIFQLGNYSFQYNGNYADSAATVFNEENITRLALQFLNTSYLWGGRTVFGVDCSGFCQTVFRFMNIHLKRDAYEQATQGKLVGFLQEVTCGDLAFFDNDEGRITHVGILLNANTIIHSSGKVRIDRIDNAGIVNSDTGERTHRLRIIKRIDTKK